MTSPISPPDSHLAEADYWARPMDQLKVSDVPTGALNLNVNGREVVSPLQGFGPLWQKTCRVRLAGRFKR